MGLPASYADVDTDRDNQIGLYEWKKAKRPLAQFTQLDANRDGFLTPRELERGASMPALAAATPTPVATPTPIAGSAPSASATSTPPAAPVVILSDEEKSKAFAAQATNAFQMLDRNRDGKVSLDEFPATSKIRPMFEQAGLNFNEPMASDQFVSNYVRIYKSKPGS
ncbi:MAG TPA: hypothetical protein VM452_07125 [Caulifigura sp.]|nr:hypothetical protein [Caulifigura sp.]